MHMCIAETRGPIRFSLTRDLQAEFPTGACNWLCRWKPPCLKLRELGRQASRGVYSTPLGLPELQHVKAIRVTAKLCSAVVCGPRFWKAGLTR